MINRVVCKIGAAGVRKRLESGKEVRVVVKGKGWQRKKRGKERKHKGQKEK